MWVCLCDASQAANKQEVFGVDASGDTVYCGDCELLFACDGECPSKNFCPDLCPDGVQAVLGISLTASNGASFSELTGGVEEEADPISSSSTSSWTPGMYVPPGDPNMILDTCDDHDQCEDPQKCVFNMDTGDRNCAYWTAPPGVIDNPSLSLKIWFLEVQRVAHFSLNNSLITEPGTCIDVLTASSILDGSSGDRDYLNYDETISESYVQFFNSTDTTGGDGKFEICLDTMTYCHNKISI